MRRIAALVTVSVVLAVLAASAFAATGVSWHVGAKKTITIRKGGSVRWTWSDGQPHNVKGPGFTSHVVSKKGTTYTHKFSKKGTFTIICQVHSSMKTVVKVK